MLVVVLCRNSDLAGVQKTLANLEDTFNKKYNYPYVFINNKPWDTAFKTQVRKLTKGKVIKRILV